MKPTFIPSALRTVKERLRPARQRLSPAPETRPLPPVRPRLRLLCVGTGRDGTQSLTHMIQRLFDESGGSASVAHEYMSRELHNAFTNYLETNDPKWMSAIETMIDECPHECIVGNGYASILPQFAARYGRQLKLIHLRRGDRTAAVRSLTENCELFPQSYGYYSPSPQAASKREAAFHFGEMTRAAWDDTPLPDKLAWYFDKTHALVEAHGHLFAERMQVGTETLSYEVTRRQLAQFVLGDARVVPPATHLNVHVDLDGMSESQRPKLQWLMGRLNLHQVADDDVYPLEYFLNAFIAWTGYQIRQTPEVSGSTPRTQAEIAAALTRAEASLVKHLKNIRDLRAALQDGRSKMSA
jgi:hypothetical protein